MAETRHTPEVELRLGCGWLEPTYSAVGLGLTVRYSAAVGLGLTVRYSAAGPTEVVTPRLHA